ncbi:TPA: radical SAM protein [Candidatus Bathyarchaeota archaeon]|nr:radical SAM protein [Candidatus Bathyarchaeota archaeon]HIJ08441.1 radical SAM protein [Candidatus Bathyarchaeota archaeon]
MQRKGPLHILPWRCTFTCNYNCVHCASAGKPAAHDEVNTEVAKRIVDQAYAFGASFFGITGGEALLRKDLFDVIAYARKTGLNASIITDGRLLDDKAFEHIVKNEVKVSVSIDGAEATNDLVRGKGAYTAAVKSIERLSREKLLNCLVYTLANVNASVTNVNEKDFVDVLDLAEAHGARWVIYHGMIPYSKDETSVKACPSSQQNEWAWNKLFDLQSLYKGKPAINVYYPAYARVAKQRGIADWDNWFNNFFLGRCFFGKFMSIAENGDAIPCSYNDFYRFGNVKSQSLQSIWDRLQENDFFTRIKDRSNLKGKCGLCEYKDICGGCRTSALFLTGDIMGSDPQCAYIPKVLRDK